MDQFKQNVSSANVCEIDVVISAAMELIDELVDEINKVLERQTETVYVVGSSENCRARYSSTGSLDALLDEIDVQLSRFQSSGSESSDDDSTDGSKLSSRKLSSWT